ANLRKQAGYPEGQRHEFVVAQEVLCQGLPLEAHLVATHHGRGRPIPEPSLDNNPVKIKLGHLSLPIEWWGSSDLESTYQLTWLQSGYLENFTRLLKEHGPWVLAYLEALLRLADYKASEA
ncbi:MAG: type I-U CRISPR-associated helicase/endonuclease Cas3, partial [Thermus sp.]|nr:type I-U CRISPR-associated helicase/endonuclease Cas3 [Thermus sp.]